MKWSPLLEEHFRGQLIGYYITYFRADLENDINHVDVYFASNSTILSNLTAYSIYAINVSAMNPGGIGPAKTAWARTEAAGNNKVEKVEFNSPSNASVTFYKKGGLTCKNYWGKFGPRLTFLSLSAPWQGPEVVIAHYSSSTSMVVRWSQLPMKQFRGQPIGYRIAYYPVELESNTNFVSVNYSTNTTTLTNLTAYTIYVINVSAVSSGGIGPTKTARARTDAEGKEVLKWL